MRIPGARSRNGQILLLSLFFLGLYLGIRALPVRKCSFLHYKDYLSHDGTIEECGIGEVDFLDLSRLRYPVKATLQPDRPPAATETVLFTFTLQNSRDEPILQEELAVSHTRRLHLLVVDASLSDYQHLHPEPTGKPGEFRFSMVPRYGGIYTAYFDFIPLRSARRTLHAETFTVAGPSAAYTAKGSCTHCRIDGKEFLLSHRLQTDGIYEIEIKLAPTEQPVRFEPIMGAYAHLVAFVPGKQGFAHLHPLNPFLDQQDPARPDLRFRFAPGDHSYYQIWAQLQWEGKERFLPFRLHFPSG